MMSLVSSATDDFFPKGCKDSVSLDGHGINDASLCDDNVDEEYNDMGVKV